MRGTRTLKNQALVYEMRVRQGMAYPAIVEATGLDYHTVRGYVSKHAARLASLPQPAPFTSTGKGAAVELQIPRYTSAFKLVGDVVVVGDIHVPTTDWLLLTLAVKFGEKHLPRGQRRLLLVGDLVNFDGLSAYDHIITPLSLNTEMAAAEAALEYLAAIYDEIYYSMGNHEYRLFKALKGELEDTRFGRMLAGGLNGKLRVSVQTQAELVSNGVHWRLTHQRNYSKLKGRVAATLAEKFHTNVITHHEHHVAVVRDSWNRFTAINNGALVDWEKLAYVGLVDSTANVMCNGFTFVRNGTGHLLTPYPSMTDWDLWGLGGAAELAVAAAAARQARMTGAGDDALR